jgi:hypothetical protein
VPDEWILLRPLEWYSERNIDLVLNSRATLLDTKQKKIRTGESVVSVPVVVMLKIGP